MNEIVERVAIAIYGADGFALAMWPPAEAWTHDREGVRQRYRGLARAAIGAMREPTTDMADAGCAADMSDEMDVYKDIYRAMIDAALT